MDPGPSANRFLPPFRRRDQEADRQAAHRGGTLLRGFYNANRIIDGPEDGFLVKIN
ncbi:hypothetical protein J7E99_03240 [Streptomyces sp. ISL-44]|uniref:hypothetical protein n=1 Tax=Streptomyces sp. ISL-44 TaxID=2819184 RepID=UPI001BE944AE|nr:hypothetical protein [Streptomyces sp. ISL-44]MBT2539747.1 hypothetical protein [Streptomyces sp. ISL-44]